jgi:tRNA (cmo5U34)-methyltransferase
MTEEDRSSLGHKPSGAWAFDDGVTRVFDDMFKRSIPQHDEMRATVVELAARFARNETAVIDLGCSLGESLAQVRDAMLKDDRQLSMEYVGAEISPPMLAASRERFAGCADVEIVDHDLRRGVPSTRRYAASIVMSVLTLQFTPIEYRQQIVASVHDALAPRGAFIMIEKVLGATARIDRTLVDAYYARKRASGYSAEEIERKRGSLEGVLVPVTARWNEDLLRGAGFSEVDCVWRSLNFAGWLAIR